MLKVICDPVYTLRDTTRCITHYMLDECARYILKTFPGSFVYYIKPEEKAVFKEDLSRDFPGRVKYFDGYCWSNNRVYEFLWRPEWYADILSSTGYAWDWDVLLTTRGPAMGQIRWLNWSKAHRPKKIVITEHFPLLEFKMGAKTYFGSFDLLQITVLESYLLSDRVVVTAPYEAGKILRTARKFLSPSASKSLVGKVSAHFVVPRGIDKQYPIDERKPKKKGEKVVGIFTQRIGLAGRKPFEVFDSFFYPFVGKKRGTVEFQLSTNSALDFPKAEKRKYSFIKFYKPDREGFYAKLRESDFCISFSTTEGMPTSILEAICWGCIPVLVRYDWSEDMCGKDYRYLFNSFSQAVAMIDEILSDIGKAYREFKKWYEVYFLSYIERCGRLFSVLDEVVAEHNTDVDTLYAKRVDTEITKLAVNYIESKKLKKFTIHELLKEMHAEKLVRVNPDQMGVGFKTQHDMGCAIPVRHPKHYQVMHSILYARKGRWRRGLEVGQIITDL